MRRKLPRFARVAIGGSLIYRAGRSVDKIVGALGDGRYGDALKGLLGLGVVRGMVRNGVASALDGLRAPEEDGSNPTRKGR